MEATIGGTRRHLVDAALGQRARGLDVHVCVATEREPRFRADLARLAAAGVGVEVVPMLRALAPATDLAHGRRIARHLARLAPDIVHTHSSKAGVLGRLASLATGVGARVHTPHTFAFLFQAMFGPLARKLFREIEAGLAQHTDLVIAVSASEAETFARSGVVEAARVRVVENGIDPAPWAAARPVARAALGVADGAFLAVTAGLLSRAKGQDLAIQALARPGLEAVELVLAGEGEERPALERLARDLRVDARVHLVGQREDLPAVFAAADAVLLPSRWEGLPYVVLEALAAGRPVVATPVDGARDLIGPGGAGILCRAISAEALAEGLRELLALDAAARAALAGRGREGVLARHTLDAMVDGLCAAYEEVA
jgi:glycosyltransferase involved in cell wall biosynthesis